MAEFGDAEPIGTADVMVIGFDVGGVLIVSVAVQVTLSPPAIAMLLPSPAVDELFVPAVHPEYATVALPFGVISAPNDNPETAVPPPLFTLTEYGFTPAELDWLKGVLLTPMMGTVGTVTVGVMHCPPEHEPPDTLIEAELLTI